MNRSKTYPGFWHAVLLCFVFVVLQVALLIPFVVLDAVFKLHLVSNPATVGIVNLAACTLVLCLAWLIGRPALMEIFTLRPVSALTIAGVVVACAGAVVLLSEAENWVRLVLPIPDRFAQVFKNLSAPPEERLWATVFLMVVIAPLTEESVFRGLILRGFLSRFSLRKSFLLSALLFGAVHLNPWQFVSAFALGLMFAWWYARTQSLIPSLIGHALANATVVGSQALPFKVHGFNLGDPLSGTDFQPLWFDLMGLLLLVTGLWLFHRSTPPILPPVSQTSELPPLPSAPLLDLPPIIPPPASAAPPDAAGRS